MTKVSAVVLTYNEEKHIRECLASLGWCDEIWIVDSNSKDRTLEIGREYTSNIVQCPREIVELVDFSALREWARAKLPLRNEWMLFVDSDERITPELAAEIEARAGNEPYVAYNLPGMQYFWGQWLRFGEASPHYQLKLFRRDRAHFEQRPVHERVEIDGEVGFMRQRMIHISVETISETIDKLNRYTTHEAIRMYRTGEELYTPASGSYSKGNTILKSIFQFLPGKPLMTFLYNYVVRQGFRDGRFGFTWALYQGLYVYFSYFKRWELKKGNVTVDELEKRWKSVHMGPMASAPTPASAGAAGTTPTS